MLVFFIFFIFFFIFFLICWDSSPDFSFVQEKSLDFRWMGWATQPSHEVEKTALINCNSNIISKDYILGCPPSQDACGN